MNLPRIDQPQSRATGSSPRPWQAWETFRAFNHSMKMERLECPASWSWKSKKRCAPCARCFGRGSGGQDGVLAVLVVKRQAVLGKPVAKEPPVAVPHRRSKPRVNLD